MAKRTRYVATDFPTCCDCGSPTLGWWASRSGYDSCGSAVRRCHSCYLAYCRERYRRQQIARGRDVRSHAQRKADRRAARRRTCSCGVSFDARPNSSKYCSDDCATDARRERNRRKNMKRRTALRVVESEPYTLRQVGDRDGWRCHLCGRRVDSTLSGSEQLGPTIDHLVPLVDLGADTLDNVALAHRICNCRRGSGGEVQLRLVG